MSLSLLSCAVDASSGSTSATFASLRVLEVVADVEAVLS